MGQSSATFRALRTPVNLECGAVDGNEAQSWGHAKLLPPLLLYSRLNLAPATEQARRNRNSSRHPARRRKRG